MTRCSLLAAVLLLSACGSSSAPSSGTSTSSSTTGAGGAGGSGGSGAAGGAGGSAGVAPTELAILDGYLLGDFDNQAQHDGGFSKLVERHVCPIPGREGDPEVLWLYVEHVEDLANGMRDAYFTRVNEVRMVMGHPVSRAYKFAAGHPLATNAFSFNGPRDGCTQPDLLAAITEADLVYREGCDVTFVKDGEVFHASTTGTGCSFPGGYITTKAEVFADGLDTQDTAVSGGMMIGDAFEFRRIPPKSP
jgi:hypothetical protein